MLPDQGHVYFIPMSGTQVHNLCFNCQTLCCCTALPYLADKKKYLADIIFLSASRCIPHTATHSFASTPPLASVNFFLILLIRFDIITQNNFKSVVPYFKTN